VTEQPTNNEEESTVEKEDLNLDNIEKMFDGTDEDALSEEFKSQTKTLFESAVLGEVKRIEKKLREDSEGKIEAKTTELAEEAQKNEEGLVERIDTYLDYVVEQWLTDNELSIEQGLRTEIAEDFITDLRGLFEQHNIDVPNEKFDVVEEQTQTIDTLQSELDEETNKHVDLNKTNKELRAKLVFQEVSENLTSTDRERFSDLTEDLKFQDEEDYRKKLVVVKDRFIVNEEALPADKKSDVINEDVDEDPLEEEDAEELSSNVNSVVQLLERTES
jgi:hypothetical protein